MAIFSLWFEAMHLPTSKLLFFGENANWGGAGTWVDHRPTTVRQTMGVPYPASQNPIIFSNLFMIQFSHQLNALYTKYKCGH